MKSLFIALAASLLFATASVQAGSLGSEGGNGSLPPPDYPDSFQYDCTIKFARSYTTSQGTSKAVLEAKVSMTEKHNNGYYGNGIIDLEKLNWITTSQTNQGPSLPLNLENQSLLLRFEKMENDFDVILVLDLNQPSLFSKSTLNFHDSSRTSFNDSKAVTIEGNLDESADSTDGSFATVSNTTTLEARCERIH